MASKVFIVNNSGHDMSAAEKFGQLVTLSEGKVNVFSTDRIIAQFKRDMADFTENDYILMAGYAALNAFAMAIALGLASKVNLLIFDFNKRSYEVRTVSRAQFAAAPKKVVEEEEKGVALDDFGCPNHNK